jgi:hypothetical protein
MGVVGTIGVVGILGMLGTPGGVKATVIAAEASVSPASRTVPNSVTALFVGATYSPLSFSSNSRRVFLRDALNSGEYASSELAAKALCVWAAIIIDNAMTANRISGMIL